MARVLCIPDLHIPFEHRDALKFLQSTYKRFNCDRVVCIGDELDAHALSNYEHNPDGWSPGHELERSIEKIGDYYKAFPNVDVVFSNHTSRIYRRAFSSGIPRAFLRDYHDWMKAPDGWKWHEHLMIDKALYVHGEGLALRNPLTSLKEAGNSVIYGHTHMGGVFYHKSKADNRMRFALNVGCLINEDAYAFRYSRHLISKPHLGCGVIIEGKEAFFVPL